MKPPIRRTTTLGLVFAALVIAGLSPESAKAEARLTETYWKLLELEGQQAHLGAGERELHLILTFEPKRARGYAGCNAFMGSYRLDADRLAIGPLASTKKACSKGMDQEQDFLEALGRTTRFAIRGDTLTFFDAEDRVTLSFAAIYLK